MILFEKDWESHPNAVVQGNTQNKSWLKCREIFIGQGISNCNWQLQLLDPSLLNVDPLDPSLTPQVLVRVLMECYNNPTYLFREVLRVKIKGSDIMDFIKADRGVLATLWLYMNGVDTTNTQLRQTGKTFKGYLIFIWLIIFRLRNSTVLWSTTTESKRRDTIKEIRGVMDCIPKHIFTPHKFDSKNYEIITNKESNNVGIFALSQKDKNAAEVNYLGFSVANSIWDEIAEATNSHISLAAATGAMGAAREQAIKMGSPYGSIYLCTAPNLLKKEGKNFYKLSKSGPGWTEKFYDCIDREDLYKTIAANGGDIDAPLVDVTLSWRQLGKTPDQFRVILKKTIANCGGDMDIVQRHCYSKPTFGSRDKPVSPAQAEVLMDNIRSDYKTITTPERGFIRYYTPYEDVIDINNSNNLIISIDTSTASGRDMCSITWSDNRSLEVLARCDVSRMMLGMFENMVARFLTEFDKAIFVIEAKSTGYNLIDALILRCCAMKIDAFSRIYNRVYQERTKRPEIFDIVSRTPVGRRTPEWYARFKEYFGFPTNSKLRHQLYDQCLIEAVTRAGTKMHDKTLVTQLVALETGKDGRVDHTAEEKDDAVISYMLAVWFSLYGRNFVLYKINPRDVLSLAPSVEDGNVKEEDISNRLLANKLESKIDELAFKLSNASGTALAKRYMELIEAMNSRLSEAGSEPRNIEDILERISTR